MTAWILVAVGLAFAVLLTAGFQEHARTFQGSILKVQYAGSGHAMHALLDRLGRDGCAALRRALTIDDRLIVPGYTGLLVSFCALSIVWVRTASSGALETVGVLVGALAGLLAITAGSLDLVENRALRRVLGGWQLIPIPEDPEETEAAARQQLRRTQVAAIDPASRTAKRSASWKYGLIALVLVWVLVAIVLALTHALSR